MTTMMMMMTTTLSWLQNSSLSPLFMMYLLNVWRLLNFLNFIRSTNDVRIATACGENNLFFKTNIWDWHENQSIFALSLMLLCLLLFLPSWLVHLPIVYCLSDLFPTGSSSAWGKVAATTRILPALAALRRRLQQNADVIDIVIYIDIFLVLCVCVAWLFFVLC